MTGNRFRQQLTNLSKPDWKVFPVLPRYPVTLKIWFADEEFPVSGKIFLQDHADHYLSVEDAVTVGEILLQKLSEAFSSL